MRVADLVGLVRERLAILQEPDDVFLNSHPAAEGVVVNAEPNLFGNPSDVQRPRELVCCGDCDRGCSRDRLGGRGVGGHGRVPFGRNVGRLRYLGRLREPEQFLHLGQRLGRG